MGDLDLAALRAVAARATEGPWRWANMGPEVYLFGARSRVAMAFGRMGMNGAQPVFRDPEDRNLLTKAGKENLNRFPDAAHIATFNPSTVLALIDEVERLRAADADA